jgi:hypothetical protein
MGTTTTNDFESLIRITAESLNIFHIRSYGMPFSNKKEGMRIRHVCLIPFSEAASTRGDVLRPSGGGNGGEMAKFMAAGALPGGWANHLLNEIAIAFPNVARCVRAIVCDLV